MTTISQRTGTIEVADKVFAFLPEPGGPHGMTNGGFIVSDDGVLVVEGFMLKSIAEKVAHEVRRVTPQPIRQVVYTHFHGDHTYGGGVFAPATIIGHQECREEMLEKWEPWVKRFSTNRPESAAEFQSLVPPTPHVTFTTRMTLFVGEKRVDLHHFGRAHSRGDIFIHLPKERVLFGGDASINARVPFVSDGYPTSWINVLDMVRTLDFEYLVPGHGMIGGKDSLALLQGFLQAIRDQALRAYKAGKSADDAAKSLQMSEYASWPGYQNLGPIVTRLYQEFSGQP
jgi:cyclase